MKNWPRTSIDIEREYRLCFCCGQDNPIGLKLDFQWDGATARAEFTPTEFYQGWSRTVHGGILICILDEANRMSEKSWASLAPLLDTRRYVESIVAGLKISADPGFRICVTMNDDASTFEIPEYIHSRLQPQIYLDFPEAEEEKRILQENLPFVDEHIIDYVVNFLQKAHFSNENFTVRDGINVARYAAKRAKALEGKAEIDALLRQSISMTLGDDALMHVS